MPTETDPAQVPTQFITIGIGFVLLWCALAVVGVVWIVTLIVLWIKYKGTSPEQAFRWKLIGILLALILGPLGLVISTVMYFVAPKTTDTASKTSWEVQPVESKAPAFAPAPAPVPNFS